MLAPPLPPHLATGPWPRPSRAPEAAKASRSHPKAVRRAAYYYYYSPSQPQMPRRPPRPAARWANQWIPQDLATSSGKCVALFKWVREDVCRNLIENNNGPEQEALKPEPTTEILFLCSYENCCKTFVDVAALRKHAHVHGERQYVCQEPGCGKLRELPILLPPRVLHKIMSIMLMP